MALINAHSTVLEKKTRVLEEEDDWTESLEMSERKQPRPPVSELTQGLRLTLTKKMKTFRHDTSVSKDYRDGESETVGDHSDVACGHARSVNGQEWSVVATETDMAVMDTAVDPDTAMDAYAAREKLLDSSVKDTAAKTGTDDLTVVRHHEGDDAISPAEETEQHLAIPSVKRLNTSDGPDRKANDCERVANSTKTKSENVLNGTAASETKPATSVNVKKRRVKNPKSCVPEFRDGDNGSGDFHSIDSSVFEDKRSEINGKQKRPLLEYRHESGDTSCQKSRSYMRSSVVPRHGLQNIRHPFHPESGNKFESRSEFSSRPYRYYPPNKTERMLEAYREPKRLEPPTGSAKHLASSFVNRRKRAEEIARQNKSIVKKLTNVKSTMSSYFR